MYQTRERDYVYHAYAIGLGGFVASDGERQNIESTGSAVLSISGGAGHVRQTDYCFFRCSKNGGNNFYIRVDDVQSEVVGYEHADGYTTRARTTLRGLDINGVVKADLVESALESHHASAACQQKQEPHIGILNSRFEGLIVSGVPVEPKPHGILDRYPTYGGLRALVDGAGEDDDDSRTLRPRLRAASLMDVPPEPPPPLYVTDLCKRYVRPDLIRCSIFDALDTGGKLETHGYSIAVPDFGRVFLGELLVTHGMKRLNMIRFDLGCDPTGGGTGGGSSVNGEPSP
jgi:hypothetical protein